MLGTIFYDKLVPVKEPVAVKSGAQTTVQTPPPPPAVVTPGKTPAKDKPANITVVEPGQTPSIETEKPVDAKPAGEKSTGEKPASTIQDKPATTIIPAVPAEPPPQDTGKPKIALIFDDMGHDQQAAKKLQDLKIPLTFSILPYTAHAQAIAQNAPKHIEIMVHVPMEAINGDSDSEQGVLKVDMTEAELAQSLRNSIGRIPNAKGINNHTGSKLTQQLVPMQVVMLVLKEKSMFFIDSKTSDKSVAKSTAAMLLVPTAERNFFLDHVADTATIKAQLYKAVSYAKKYGSAVVIGHPRPLTLEVVLKELPKLTKDIEFVPASALVK